jgi:fibronectin-binding autotransporter adhesin
LVVDAPQTVIYSVADLSALLRLANVNSEKPTMPAPSRPCPPQTSLACTFIALLTATVAAALPGRAVAQNTYNWGGVTGGAWLTTGNWSGGAAGKFPGVDNTAGGNDGTTTDIATFANSATNAGINMNTASGLLSVGAINLTGSSNLQIGDSSTTVNGVLQLNGAFAGNAQGLSTTTLLNATGANLTIANVNSGAGSQTMGLRLGITNGIFNAASGRTITVSSIISEASGGSQITTQGGGTVTLTGNNTYTGGTIITGATLMANATTNNSAAGTGPVTVGSGGTLAGTGFTGTNNGSVYTVQSGGAVFAGNTSAATGGLTINADLSLQAGSTLSTVANSASAASLLTVNGALTLPGGGDTQTIKIFSNGSLDVSGNATYTINLVNATSGVINNFATTNFQVLAGNFPGISSYTVSNPTANSIQVQFTPVPEPAMALAACAAAVSLAQVARRRSRTARLPA